MNEQVGEILEFWFGVRDEEDELPSREALWFERSSRVERFLRKRFGRLMDRALAGDLDDWATSARGRLALILLLDEMPRRIHGETPQAFRGEERALQLSYDGMDEEMDKALDIPERAFFYLPCMHAEDTDAQLASVEVYSALADEAPPSYEPLAVRFLRAAEKRREVVERFERFPHRNAILDRSSTPEESAFLQTSGDELI